MNLNVLKFEFILTSLLCLFLRFFYGRKNLEGIFIDLISGNHKYWGIIGKWVSVQMIKFEI